MACLTSAVQHSNALWGWETLRWGGGLHVGGKHEMQRRGQGGRSPTWSCPPPHVFVIFVSSRLEWSLPCVAQTVGCWRFAQVWDPGRGVRLLRRISMIRSITTRINHISRCSMWLWRDENFAECELATFQGLRFHPVPSCSLVGVSCHVKCNVFLKTDSTSPT